MSDFAKYFHLRPPAIIQAPMAGGVTTPALVAAVSNASGLGSFATGYLTLEQVISGIQAVKALTSKPFAVNLFIPPANIHFDQSIIREYQTQLNAFRKILGLPEEDCNAVPVLPVDPFTGIADYLLNEKIAIVSFTFGILPKKYIQAFKANDVYLIGTATSVEEAVALEVAGIDAVVVQGCEAGGHRGSFITPFAQAMIPTMNLIAIVKEKVRIPVIAAGGIMTAAHVKQAMSLGASAVQMGTAFLTTAESGANAVYKAALENAKQSDSDLTAVTAAYSGKPARGLKTDFMRAMQDQQIPDYPIAHYLAQAIRKAAALQNNPDFMSLWCGQGIREAYDVNTASDVLEKIYQSL